MNLDIGKLKREIISHNIIKGPGSKGGKGYWNDQGKWIYGNTPQQDAEKLTQLQSQISNNQIKIERMNQYQRSQEFRYRSTKDIAIHKAELVKLTKITERLQSQFEIMNKQMSDKHSNNLNKGLSDPPPI